MFKNAILAVLCKHLYLNKLQNGKRKDA